MPCSMKYICFKKFCLCLIQCPNDMKSFLKYTLASTVGVFLAGFFLFILSMAMIGAMISSVSMNNKEIVNVKSNSVLHLKLNKAVVDRAPKDPFENIEIEGLQGEKRMTLSNITEALEDAASDDNIKGIYLDISGVQMSFPTMSAVRQSLLKFKESGKFVYAYSEQLSQGAYYLASTADELYLYPEGGMMFQGLNVELMYMKGMLDKLDIEAQIVRGPDNIYKSAVEPFMSDKMSDANREQLSRLITVLWEDMTNVVSESRGVSVDKLNMMADSLSITDAEAAVEHQLVDGLKYQDEVYADLRGKLELEDDDKINFIALSKYMKAGKSSDSEEGEEERKPWEIDDKIAVIYANGGIQSGEGDDETIGSERIAKAIRTARKDTTIKAVVLRVNSPGGSALASDVIWRETILTKKEKPFVVSMGDVAASGGYYIACGADKIYASPTTITGSIGVFGMIPNVEGFLNNKLGLNFERVTTNEHSSFMRSVNPMSASERKIVQASVDDIYYDFIGKVAEGRNMTEDQVHELARGRVWTGLDAKANGLVDELGTLDDAIAYAAEQAELEDYNLEELPSLKDPFEELFKNMADDLEARVVRYSLGSNYKYFQRMQDAQNMTGIQARLPYFIEVY